MINEDLLNSWQCANCICKGYYKLENNTDDRSYETIMSSNETRLDHEKSILRRIIFEKQKMAANKEETSNEQHLTVHSLSNFEKEFILSEFCEILTEDDTHGNEAIFNNDIELYRPLIISNNQFIDFNNNKSDSIDKNFNKEDEDIYWKPCVTIN